MSEAGRRAKEREKDESKRVGGVHHLLPLTSLRGLRPAERANSYLSVSSPRGSTSSLFYSVVYCAPLSRAAPTRYRLFLDRLFLRDSSVLVYKLISNVRSTFPPRRFRSHLFVIRGTERSRGCERVNFTDKMIVFVPLLWGLLAWTTSTAEGISTSWRPSFPIAAGTVLPQTASAFATGPAQSLYDHDASSLLTQQEQDRCTLYKVSMSQQLYFEYIQYKTELPDIKEFTLCMWTKFHNHSNDHPLFSYAVGDQPRGILSWVANTARSSYYMMNVNGHNLYRLNYPLRLNKWYHSCQSWNGRTGEWQIWVNDERVGRGFNNRLVGHVIKGGGIAITGQEQRQLGGGFLEGEGAPQGSGGLLGEVTMVQLYEVALTAGKAHKDHKHHHAHRYEHDTNNNTPRPTRPPVTSRPLPQHPYLTGGQINSQIKLNPGTPLQIVQSGVTLRHPALLPRDPPLQPLPPAKNPTSSPALFSLQPSQFFGNPQPTVNSPSSNGIGANFADGSYHNLFKREKNSLESGSEEQLNSSLEEAANDFSTIKKKRADQATNERSDGKVTFVPRESSEKPNDQKNIEKRSSEPKKKRELVQLGDGLILDDGYINQGLDNEYFAGLTNFGLQLPKYENKDDEREPAEAEVKMIMDVCDGCAEEPFSKALIMAWRSVPKKLYSGALHLPASPICKAF